MRRSLVLLCLTSVMAVSVLAEERPPDRRTFFGSSSTTSDKPAGKTAASPQKEGVLELLRQQEALQEEVKQLRNTIELQGHELNTLKNRQRTLYDDLDKRLREVEKGRGTATAAEPVATAEGGAAGAAPAAPRTTNAAQQQEYDAAYALMKDGQYERAMKALRAFLAKHPSSGLADNAQYWIGECNYVLRNYKLALEEYSKVLNYPNAGKLPDAMLKIGYVHYELGAWDKARKALTGVTERFPGTHFAKLAGDRLAKMKKEGH
jgi:tol-pal system protein YbgF